MRRNRKVPTKMSVIAVNSMYIGSLLFTFFIMVIVNHLASSSCSQLNKAIGDKRVQLARLEDERQRESARWEEMSSPDRLEAELTRHGLSMHYAHESQNIRMGADGTPRLGQISVAMAHERVRQRLERTASLSPAPVRAAAPSAPVRQGAAAAAPRRRGTVRRR